MFSALNQGSRVYILNKANEIDFKIGEVVGTTTPVEDALDKCEDRDNRYDEEENYRRNHDYDRREHDYEDRDREYGRSRYGRY